MKSGILVSSTFAAFAVLAGLLPQASAQPVALGSASSFAVLAGSGITVAGAVSSTAITGDIGTFPTTTITGLGNIVLVGVNHAGDAVTQLAKNDLVTAYNTAAGRITTLTVATELGSTTRGPGVYDSASGTFGMTGILTLNAGGDPNAVFVFKTSSSLITAASSQVVLTNGAQASNVFWQVGSSATLGSSSIFRGNILALTAITVGTSAAVEGRVLARNSFVQFDGSNSVSLPLTTQLITFAAVADRGLCDGAFTVAPTSSSGLTVALAVTSGPATVVGNTVTVTGTGSVTLQATQAGNGTFAAALPVSRTFAVAACPPGLTAQTITFVAVPGRTLCDGAFTVSPTATSGLPVTLAVTSGPATVVGNTVTVTGTGSVTLQATQAGNGTFAAATAVSQTFAVTTCAQAITFAAVPDRTLCDGPFAVNATASSGLPVTFAVTSGPATISGNTVTLTGAGSVTLQATQAGNGTFAGAAPVSRTFVVAACAQAITFAALPSHTACDVPFTFVYPVSTSGLPVTLSVSGPATVSGNTVTLTGAIGTVVLTATQTGNATFAGASNVAQSFVVVACIPASTAQSITFAAIGNHTACDEPFTFTSPTASSGLPVTLAVSGPATVLGNTVTLTGVVGTVAIVASQAGNSTFGAAPSVTQSFTVGPCCVPPIINSPLTAAARLGVPFSYTTTASGSPTSYSSTTLPAGLSLNALTGVISGSPTQQGTTSVTLTATSSTCSGTAVLTIVVGPVDCIPPVITNDPLIASGMVGVPFSYTITATGSPTRYSAFNLPPGLSLNTQTGVISGTPTHNDDPPAFTTTVVANSTDSTPPRERTLGPTFVTLTASNGDCTSPPVYLMIVIGPTAVIPIITSATSVCPATVGTPFSYAITASGTPTTYAALNLPPGLTLDSSTGAISGTPTRAGTYPVTLRATNSAGTSTSTLVLVVAPVSSLVNVSARMNVTTGEGTLIVGLVIAGSGPKTVLVRGVGPTLSAFGVATPLADPRLTVFSGSTIVATNDNWESGTSTAAQLVSASAQVGAFALTAGSRDAALLATLQPGAYTVQVSGVGSATGAVLVEVYDTQ